MRICAGPAGLTDLQTAIFNIGGCTNPRCLPHIAAWTCTPTDDRSIAICQGHWGLSAPQRAAMIVHESVHMPYLYAEDSGNLRQRGTNAGCYASLILDLRGEGAVASIASQFATADPSCPP